MMNTHLSTTKEVVARLTKNWDADAGEIQYQRSPLEVLARAEAYCPPPRGGVAFGATRALASMPSGYTSIRL